MTIIAWDGNTIAADKRAVCQGASATTTKLRRLPTGEVLGWTGEQASGEIMAKWYADGADVTKWPKCQEDKDAWCLLIIASQDGVKFYERQPIAIPVEDAFRAWGSGRDYALAAMYLGKSASHAVAVACEFDTSCGNGIDIMVLRK